MSGIICLIPEFHVPCVGFNKEGLLNVFLAPCSPSSVTNIEINLLFILFFTKVFWQEKVKVNFYEQCGLQ